MATFAERLREEIEYVGLSRKELAYKANVKQRALDMYLGTQESMPPADVAVRIAKVLNVTVEYLVTGERGKEVVIHEPLPPKINRDLEKCGENTRKFLETAVHLFAEYEKRG